MYTLFGVGGVQRFYKIRHLSISPYPSHMTNLLHSLQRNKKKPYTGHASLKGLRKIMLKQLLIGTTDKVILININ